MDVKRLKYFLAVADAGSFVGASTTLRVAQPALSQQIANLEAELGVMLFNRSHRGVELTPAGRLLAGHAKDILASLKRAEEEIGRLRSTSANQVLTIMPPSLARLLSFSFIKKMAQDLPHAHLNILDSAHGMERDLFLNGQIAFALLFKPSDVKGVKSTALVQEPLCLIGPRTGKSNSATVSIAELDGLSLILAAHPNGMRERIDAAFDASGVNPRIDSEYNSLATICDAVDARGLPTVLPRSLVAQAIDEGKLTAARIVAPEIEHLTFVGVSELVPWRAMDHAALRALIQVVIAAVDSGGWPGAELCERKQLQALTAQAAFAPR